MKFNTTGPIYGFSYVVAENPKDAYEEVRMFLDKENLGFKVERVLDTIELLAEQDRYPECRTMLFIAKNTDLKNES